MAALVIAAAVQGAAPAAAQPVPPAEILQQATELRTEATAHGDATFMLAAVEAYHAAAGALRDGLRTEPPGTRADLWRFQLADALYWTGEYEAASLFESVARSSDEARRALAARRAVESIESSIAAQHVVALLEAPEPGPGGVLAVPFEPLIDRLFAARELYLRAVDDAHDTERRRDTYDLDNALLLYVYGRWPAARERFTAIYEAQCLGPRSSTRAQTVSRSRIARRSSVSHATWSGASAHSGWVSRKHTPPPPRGRRRCRRTRPFVTPSSSSIRRDGARRVTRRRRRGCYPEDVATSVARACSPRRRASTTSSPRIGSSCCVCGARSVVELRPSADSITTGCLGAALDDRWWRAIR